MPGVLLPWAQRGREKSAILAPARALNIAAETAMTMDGDSEGRALPPASIAQAAVTGGAVPTHPASRWLLLLSWVPPAQLSPHEGGRRAQLRLWRAGQGSFPAAEVLI